MFKKAFTAIFSIALLFMLGAFFNVSAADAAGTAITNEAEFKAIESNPAGEYFLANDITISDASVVTEAFTGSFDGNGKTITFLAPSAGIDTYSLFASASGAKFSNFSIVAPSITAQNVLTMNYYGITAKADNCAFSDITVKGTLQFTPVFNQALSSGEGGYPTITYGGLVGAAAGCTFTNCKAEENITYSGLGGVNIYRFAAEYPTAANTFTKCSAAGSINITAKWGANVGFAPGENNFTSCSNSASINISLDSDGEKRVGCNGIGDGQLKKCTNTGNISVIMNGSGDGYSSFNISVAGVSEAAKSAKNCSNKGKINVIAKGFVRSFNANVGGITAKGDVMSSINSGSVTLDLQSSTSYGITANVGGIAATTSNTGSNLGVGTAKSTNKGAVTLKLKEFYSGTSGANVGGIAATGAMKQCYNTGAVKSVHPKTVTSNVGGIVGSTSWIVQNCYNAGKVSSKGDALIGGIVGNGNFYPDNQLKFNANSGKVSGGNKFTRGSIAGNITGANVARKRGAFDNYTTIGGKMYGKEDTTWKPFMAKGTKVSSISKGSCRKLSAKAWKVTKGKFLPKGVKLK